MAFWAATILPAVALIRPAGAGAGGAGSGSTPSVAGHRGAAGLAPENTLAAFSRACALGVDGVELDVLVSADGELVVHHDFRIKP